MTTAPLRYSDSDDKDASWNESLDDEMNRFFKRKQRVLDVQARFERLASKSPFVQNRQPADVARFHRSEIKTGKLLGEGGFAHVYEITGFDLFPNAATSSAEAASLRQAVAAEPHKYALKQVKPDTKDYRVAASDMAMEAAMLLRMEEHPNCIALKALPLQWLKACEEKDGFFLILERVDSTLETQLELWDSAHLKCAPSDEVRFRYAQEMANVLHHLHSHGLVYRDMKPDNVGFKLQDDGSYTIKLFDFGLCRGLPDNKPVEDLYQMSCVGTPRYAAPEVLSMMLNEEKRGLYNNKVDVYGWAVVVWQLYSLRRPKDYLPPTHWNLKSVPDALRTILLHSWSDSIERRSDFPIVLKQLETAELHMASEVQNKKPLKARFSALLRRRSAQAA